MTCPSWMFRNGSVEVRTTYLYQVKVQMACVHLATMAVLGRLGGGHGGDRHVLAAATAARRLSRSFAILAETLRRLRSGGSQVIRIERVDVRDGGIAISGNVKQERRKDF